MTTEERLARSEVMIAELKDDIKELRSEVRELLQAAHMGKGAWWLILRLGAVLAAFAAVIGWVFDKWPRK